MLFVWYKYPKKNYKFEEWSFDVSLAGCSAIVVRVSLTNNLFSIHRVRHLLGDRINDSFKETGDIISKNKEQTEVTFVIKQLHYIY